METTPPGLFLPEILGEIFGWVVASEREAMREHDRGHLLRLMLVCKWWRDAALITHDLWSRVHWHLRRSSSVEKIISWFSKAGVYPKTLTIEGTGFGCGHYDASSGSIFCILKEFLDSLLAGSPLDRLILQCPQKCFRKLMCETQGSLSPLWNSVRHLIWSSDGWDWMDYLPAPTLLPVLPASLSSLQLTLLSLDSQAGACYEIPPSALRDLKSLVLDCRGDATPILGLLQHCVNLQRLSIDLPNSQEMYPSELREKDRKCFSRLEPIPLPFLKSLDIRTHSPRDTDTFLGLLCAPNLMTIRMHHDRRFNADQCDLWDLLNSLRVFTRSPGDSTVRSLTLFANTAPPPEVPASVLFNILSQLPSLSHLTFENVTFNVEEFLALRSNQESDARQQRVSQLECIELDDPGGNFDIQAFLEHLRTCAGYDGCFRPLRRVVLKFHRYYPKDARFLHQYQACLESHTFQELETLSGIVVEAFRK